MTSILSVLLLLLSAFSLNPEPEADVQAIVGAVLTAPQTTRYLPAERTKGEAVLLWYEQAPTYDAVAVPKPCLALPQKPGLVLRCARSEQETVGQVAVIIQSLVIAHDTATVEVSIPLEGVKGTFVLHRGKGWVVASAELFEV